MAQTKSKSPSVWTLVQDGSPVVGTAINQHLCRNSKNVFALLCTISWSSSCFILQLVLAPPPTQPAQPGCLCLQGFWCFSPFYARLLFREENCSLVCGRMASSPTSVLTVSLEVPGAREPQWMNNMHLRTPCCRKRQKTFFCRLPSLLTCIIQFNIFPFYTNKYSWTIKAQGKLVQNLESL